MPANSIHSLYDRFVVWQVIGLNRVFAHVWNETRLGGYLRNILHHRPATYAKLAPHRVRWLSMNVVNVLKEKLFKAIPAEHFTPEQCQEMGRPQLLALIRAGTLHKVIPHLPQRELAFTLKQPSVPQRIVPLLEKGGLEGLLKPDFKLEAEIRSGLSSSAERLVACWHKYVGRDALQPFSSKVHALLLAILTTSDCPQLISTLTLDQLRVALSSAPRPEFIKRLGQDLPASQLIALIKSIPTAQDPCSPALCQLMGQIENPLAGALARLAETMDMPTLIFFLQFPSCAHLLAHLSDEKLRAYLREVTNLHPALAHALTHKQSVSLILGPGPGYDSKVAAMLAPLPKERLDSISTALAQPNSGLTSAFLPRLFSSFQKLNQDQLFASLTNKLADPHLTEALEAVSCLDLPLAQQAWSGPIARSLPPERIAAMMPLIREKAAIPSCLPALPLDYAKGVLSSLATAEELLFWFSCFKGQAHHIELTHHLTEQQLLTLRSPQYLPEAFELLALGLESREDVALLQTLFATLGNDPRDLPLCARLAQELHKNSDTKLHCLFAFCTPTFIQTAIDHLKQTPDERVERLLIQHHPHVRAYLERGRFSIEQRAWLFDRWLPSLSSQQASGLLYQLHTPVDLLSTCKPLSADQLRLLAQVQNPPQPAVKQQLAAEADRAQHINVIRLLPLLGLPLTRREQLPMAIATMAPAQIQEELRRHCGGTLVTNEFISAAQQLLAPDNALWLGQLSALIENLSSFPDDYWHEYLRQLRGLDIDPRLLGALLLKMDPRGHVDFIRRTSKGRPRASAMEATLRWALLLNRSDDDRPLFAFLNALKGAGYKPSEYLPQFEDQRLQFSTSSERVLKTLWEENSSEFERWEGEMEKIESGMAKIASLMNVIPFKKLQEDLRKEAQRRLAKFMPNLRLDMTREPFLGVHFLARVQKLLGLHEGWSLNRLLPWGWQNDSVAHLKKIEPSMAGRLRAVECFYQERLKEQQEQPADPDEASMDTLSLLVQRSVVITSDSMTYIWKTFRLTPQQKICLSGHLSDISDLKNLCGVNAADSVDSMLEKIVAFTQSHRHD